MVGTLYAITQLDAGDPGREARRRQDMRRPHLDCLDGQACAGTSLSSQVRRRSIPGEETTIAGVVPEPRPVGGPERGPDHKVRERALEIYDATGMVRIAHIDRKTNSWMVNNFAAAANINLPIDLE